MYRHLARGWVPPTPGLLESIQESVGQHSEILGEDIIEDISADFSILSHCLRSLKDVAREKLWEKDPMEILAALNQEQLQQIFDISDAKLSLHRFRRIGKFQKQQLSHSITSLSGLDVLSAEAQLVGHELVENRITACGAVRQLVPNLIAWNYPRLFPKILHATRRGEGTLEANIARILGDSPRRLAAAFASDWQLRPQLLQAIRYTRENQNPNLPRKIDYSNPESAEALGAICELAEGLAKLQNPRQFPTAEREWSESVPEIERMLGSDKTITLVKNLEEEAGEKLERYSSIVGDSLFTRRVTTQRRQLVEVASSSRGLQHCEPALQESLGTYYDLLEDSPIDALHWLLNKTVPAAGFRSGCVFLARKGQEELRPTVFIGTEAKGVFAASDPYISKIIAASIFKELPFSEAGYLKSNYHLQHVSAAMGGAVELGVLCLEVAKTEESNFQPGGISHFKAIRAALHESLNLIREQMS